MVESCYRCLPFTMSSTGSACYVSIEVEGSSRNDGGGTALLSDAVGDFGCFGWVNRNKVVIRSNFMVF